MKLKDSKSVRPAGEREWNVPKHADLTLDVAPFTRCLEVLGQDIVKVLPHSDDPVCHGLHLTLPLAIKIIPLQNGVDDVRPMGGRIGVHWTDDNLQLALDARLFFVLRKRLVKSNLVALLSEVTRGECIASGRAGGKALVSHVEEREESAFLANSGDSPALVKSRVNSGRVIL